MATASKVHSYLPAKKVVPLMDFDVKGYQDLARLGINLSAQDVKHMAKYAPAMDAVQPLVTTASVTTPVQFLQFWLPGFVQVITAARKIDDLIGIMNAGSWEDEQVVQGIMERTGTAVPYGDYTNMPRASWNNNFVTRTVVRFEEGMSVGVLEQARASRMNVNDSAEKRQSCAMQLEIERNLVGFFGFNAGANNTYGFLNDPGLLAYTQVAAGIAGRT